MKFITIGNAKKQTGFAYLGGVNISQKILKSQKVDNIMTYCLYLAPYNLSGYNVCKFSTKECRLGCLFSSGRAKMEYNSGQTKIVNSRIGKTKLFFEHNEFFMQWLIAEIKSFQNKAKKKGMGFIVRLNGMSDIDWQDVKYNGMSIFEIFPEIMFYDYTKNPNKFGMIPNNYHLTFSYTGKNWSICEALLERGHNISVVFNVPNNLPLPSKFRGYDVIDGDITDARVKDKKGIVVGLHWKRIGNKENEKIVLNSCFVVDPKNIEILQTV